MNNQEYSEVPNIITGKDLDYLSDMFEWNYGSLKKVDVGVKCVEDSDIRELLDEGYNLFLNNLNVIISILNEGCKNE